jgi:4-hydroxy-tetrahydrodipicolinate synthase
MFAGSHTALVTPFSNGSLDESALKNLIDAQFEAGITGIVPCGTTGESPTLDYEEHERVIKLAVEFAAGRGPVIAGTGSNSTREAVELTEEAEAAGATGALLVAPYYNKPTQEGLFEHYRSIAQSTRLPLMLYSIPGRCGIEIGLNTLVRLAEACPNIRAIKEAGGTPERVSQICQELPEDFEVDFRSALEVHRKFYPLFSSFLKLATNPIPIKTAMGLAGRIDPQLRLPLTAMDASGADQLKATMVDLGLLDS